jgi:hypothetical protein
MRTGRIGRFDDAELAVQTLATTLVPREWSGLEVGGGGAIDVGNGPGDAGRDASFLCGEEDLVEVVLDGGTVFGEDKGDGGSTVTVRGALASVQIAEAGVFEGGGLAAASVGHDVLTKREHGVSPLKN